MAQSNGDTTVIVAEIYDASLQNTSSGLSAYHSRRKTMFESESVEAWDSHVKGTAPQIEQEAASIVWLIRENDRDIHFGNKASEAIPELWTRDLGGQFLTNLDRIEDSRLFQIALRMPKGAHLHLHFNAELPPRPLLERARNVPTMCIRSTRPIITVEDTRETEIVFSVMPDDTVEADLFSLSYNPEFKKEGSHPWMQWSRFRGIFMERFGQDAEAWAADKMILSEEEVYGMKQTTNGYVRLTCVHRKDTDVKASVWARFNQGTRAFKGLVNYDTIYRWYIGAAIDNMITDRIMYAELRPMLLDKSIPSQDGRRKFDLAAQMQIIADELGRKQQELMSKGEPHRFPFGIKIIYCTPRSIPKEIMKRELQDCIKLKLAFPELICGMSSSSASRSSATVSTSN